MSELLLARAGRRRSPATMPGFHAGRGPRNKGLRYPADPWGPAGVDGVSDLSAVDPRPTEARVVAQATAAAPALPR